MRIQRMLDLIDKLNNASNLYYNEGQSFLTDEEFDKYMKELQRLEFITGIVLSNSPSINVGYEVLDSVKKIKIIDRPMLSLEKVYTEKDIDNFSNGQEIVGMIKFDGLSVRIIYENGKLVSANTRGDGYIGADITEHIKHFTNVPLSITTQRRYVIDGEAIIKIFDFNEINKNKEFSNPRNTAAGSLNLLDMKEVKNRRLSFIAWDVVSGTLKPTLKETLKEASEYGFEVADCFSREIGNLTILETAKTCGIPCDGVVWKYNNLAYGNAQGATAHHYRSGVAWKREVETYTTFLKDIDWTMGRTGQITPVAIVEPVEIDGTIVERANLHNLTIMKKLLGTPCVGQEVEIFKANEIIPQIKNAKWEGKIENILLIPDNCPICNAPTEIECVVDSEVLKCNNPQCLGQLVNRLDHFCGKKGLDIKGLSKATLSKLVELEWVNEPADLYNLQKYRDEWVKLPGFGEKSVDKILLAIENSRTAKLDAFISALGIPLVGKTLSKELVKYIHTYEEFRNKILEKWDFTKLDGVAYEKASSILSFNYNEADRVYDCMFEVKVEEPAAADKTLENKKIVITGTLQKVKNRGELQSLIEAAGGRVVAAVSRNTDMLINNNPNSTSSKNTAAKKLNIPILTEEEFFKLYLTF